MPSSCMTCPATCASLGKHVWLRERTAAKEEGRRAVRGNQEPDRTTPAAFAQNEVRSRAVLPGSGCPKHQAVGPLPQSSTPTSARRDGLVSNPRKKLFFTSWHPHPTNVRFRVALFQQPRLLTTATIGHASGNPHRAVLCTGDLLAGDRINRKIARK